MSFKVKSPMALEISADSLFDDRSFVPAWITVSGWQVHVMCKSCALHELSTT